MTTIYYEKPSILERLAPDRHAVIEASAGTGKTFTLKHLVVDLVLRGVPIEQILIVTFTRRATAELKRQVREVLSDVLDAWRSKKECGRSRSSWTIDAAAAGLVREALLSFDNAEIYTIHSFCQKLLTEHAFENRKLFDMELVDEEALFETCFAEVVRGAFSTDPSLRRWLDAWMLPSVDGSANSLREKLYEAHRSAGQLQRPPEPNVTPEALLQSAHEKTRAGKTLGTKEKYHLCTIILQELQAQVLDAVRHRKEQHGLYCYSDMLSMVAESLRRCDEGKTELRDLIRAQYKCALIDEFQDTDPEQWEIFRRAFVDGTTQHRLFIIGDPKQAIYGFRGADVWTYVRAARHLGARGDKVKLEHNFRSTHAMVSAYNELLRQDEAAPFFTSDDIQYSDPVKPNPVFQGRVRTRSNATPSALTALRLNAPQDELSAAGCKDRWLDWIVTEIDSLLWGQGRLEFDDRGDGQWRPIQANDIYVLTNSNAEAHLVGHRLRERAIPCAFYRQDGLFGSHEAHDVLALLHAIAEPKHTRHRRAAYRTPFFGVPITHLLAFDEAHAEGGSAQECLREWHQLAEQRHFNRLFESVVHQSGVLRRELLLGEGERALTNYLHLFELLAVEATGANLDVQGLIGWLSGQMDETLATNADEQDIQRLETDSAAVQIMTMHKAKGLEAQIIFIFGGFSNSRRGMPTVLNADDPAADDADRATFYSTSKTFLPTEIKSRVTEQQAWESERLMYVAMTRAKSRLYVCYQAHEKGKGRSGRHERLAEVLDRVQANNSMPDQIEFVDVGEVGSHPAARPVEDVPREALAAVPKTIETIDQALDEKQSAAPDYFHIRRQVRESVSFSGVQTFTGGQTIELRELDEMEPAPSEDDEQTYQERLRDDRFGDDQAVLHGGTRPGSFLHDILEHLADDAAGGYASVLESASSEEWGARPEVARVLDAQYGRHRIDQTTKPYVTRLLYDTLRTPVDLPDGRALETLASAERHACEVDFYFPIPEDDHVLGAWPKDGPEIRRGWVEGKIDLVFSQGERVYIADWKSNVRDDYSPEPLAVYVDNAYALQAKLYTLGVVRMLGIGDAEAYERRFGGCYYFFVRGMRPEPSYRGQGIVCCRPPWDEIEAWDSWLKQTKTSKWKQPMQVFSHAANPRRPR